VIDDLLPFYERELAVLRRRSGQFAEQNPKIAGRLNLGRDDSQDPHVERLLQGVAFLNAHLTKRLDDDFPELAEALLDLLYPHYLRPLPSMTIVEMAIDPKQAALVDGHRVPRGSLLESERIDGDVCTYRTCFDMSLWPVKIAAAKLSGPPFRLPILPPASTQSVLDIEIEPLSKAIPIGKMNFGKLRFHLHVGAGQPIYLLYELLLTRCVGIVISSGPEDASPVVLPRERLVAAGFDTADASVPTDPRAFPGYRLLSELFAMPQKFLFIDLEGLSPSVIGRLNDRMCVSILLSAASRELERLVSPTAIRLGCTPVVNLFPHRLDPLRITGTRSEYCLVPDVRRPRSLEIYTIESVRGSTPGGKPFSVLPFYSPSTVAAGNVAPAPGTAIPMRWSAMRRTHLEPRPDGGADGASDMWMALVDGEGGPTRMLDVTIHCEATCTNRNLPSRLPFAVGRPRFALTEGQGPVGAITCLSRPTRPLRRQPGRGNAWRLISHLSLNFLSLVDGGEGRASLALRDMLNLYLNADLDDFSQKQRWIQGLSDIRSRRIAGRVPGRFGGVAQGLEVTLVLDESQFIDNTAYLFSSVLERFFGSWVTINAFTRMIATSRQQESRKEQWTWPPRAGNRVLA
jgi:type VI secretion system protein ImpG